MIHYLTKSSGLSPEFGHPKKRTKVSATSGVSPTEGADSVLHYPAGKANALPPLHSPPHSPPRAVLSDTHSFDSARNKGEGSTTPAKLARSPESHVSDIIILRMHSSSKAYGPALFLPVSEVNE